MHLTTISKHHIPIRYPFTEQFEKFEKTYVSSPKSSIFFKKKYPFLLLTGSTNFLEQVFYFSPVKYFKHAPFSSFVWFLKANVSFFWHYLFVTDIERQFAFRTFRKNQTVIKLNEAVTRTISKWDQLAIEYREVLLLLL